MSAAVEQVTEIVHAALLEAFAQRRVLEVQDPRDGGRDTTKIVVYAQPINGVSEVVTVDLHLIT